MNKRLFLVLILILSVLLIVIKKQSKDREYNLKNPENRILKKNDIKNINKMEFDFRTGKKYSFTLEDGSWYMNEPYKFECDFDSIKRIIRSIREIESHTQVKYEKKDIKEFGLDEPHIDIKLFNDSESVILKCGDHTFDSIKRFLFYDQKIYVVSNSFEKNIDKDPLYFKKKNIFKIDKRNVGRWNFYSTDFDINYFIDENDTYEIQVTKNREKISFDNKMVNSLFDHFCDLNAINWVELNSKDLTNYSFENSDYGFEFYDKDNRKLFSAVIIKKDNSLFLKDLKSNDLAEISDSFEYYIEKLIIENKKEEGR